MPNHTTFILISYVFYMCCVLYGPGPGPRPHNGDGPSPGWALPAILGLGHRTRAQKYANLMWVTDGGQLFQVTVAPKLLGSLTRVSQ